jgi:pyrroloquinoline quinone biosynthesis protein B
MIVKVLGSAAGGGFPQANCACRNCDSVRRGAAGYSARTQASVAVSQDGASWLLLNAAPDLRQQIAATPQLAPRPAEGLRGSPIEAVVLTNGDVDAVAGLLSLREGFRFTLYGAARVLETLASNSIFDVLAPDAVARVPLSLGERIEAREGLTVEAFAVPGKIALYLEQAGPSFGTRTGDTIGLEVRDPLTGAAFFYIPACAEVDAALAARLRGARLVLFDGTLYTDDEMIAQGLSAKTGRRMGHISMSGEDGSIAALAGLGIERRVFVHINNSNPVLDDAGAERRSVEAAGWEVAFDGMEIRL